MSKVKVILNTNTESEYFGELITPSTNREDWGSIAIEQIKNVFAGNILNKQRRVALIQGTMETLQEFIKDNKVSEGTLLDGQIVVEESFTPFWEGQQAKQTPDGQLCVVTDEDGTVHNIYRRTVYDATGEAKDTLIRHTDLVASNVNAAKSVFTATEVE